jgi:hypothetical protein
MTAVAGCGGRVVVDSGTGGDGGGGGASSSTTSNGTTGGGTTGGGTTGGGTIGPWESYPFDAAKSNTPCTGERYVTYAQKYAKWVGVVLCDPNRYKIFLGESKEGTFYEIGDLNGSGQDHCELVNPDFTIPNDDDIKSGGCSACEVAGGWEAPLIGQGYARAYFGEPFTFDPAIHPQSFTSTWYECGVAIP